MQILSHFPIFSGHPAKIHLYSELHGIVFVKMFGLFDRMWVESEISSIKLEQTQRPLLLLNSYFDKIQYRPNLLYLHTFLQIPHKCCHTLEMREKCFSIQLMEQ